MPDMEKVIMALELHRAGKCQDTNRQLCPYWKYYDDCYKQMADDILSLLKEQEAKVITREELKKFVGRPCWFESHGSYMGKEGFWIIPSMFRTFSASAIISYVSVLIKNSEYGMADTGELGLSAYNKVWRCWSSKPTDEQREAVKWE